MVLRVAVSEVDNAVATVGYQHEAAYPFHVHSVVKPVD